MATWHRSRRADLGLRAIGLLLCGTAYLAIRHFVALHTLLPSAGVIAYGFAALGFMSAIAGSAMLILGNHLFDEIEVSARWRANPSESPIILQGHDHEHHRSCPSGSRPGC